METKILSECEINIAGEIIKNGGTVVFPTETVYGLGADALNSHAVEKIFIAKGRPSDNPLIVHIAKTNQLDSLVKNIPEKAKIIMEKFWPGPITLIFDKTDNVPKRTSGGLDTVAIRMPKNPVALKLIESAKTPIAAPSANISGRPSPTTFNHVYEDMNGKVDAIVKSGDCDFGVESTVLDVRGEIPFILRPGGITKEQIEDVIGKVECSFEVSNNDKPVAPGMKYKHYAPKAEVYIVRGNFEKFILANKEKDIKIGLLVTDDKIYPENFVVKRLGNTNKDFAHRLFACLREFDKLDVQKIYAQDIGNSGILLAVNNRLYKSAGYKVIEVD